MLIANQIFDVTVLLLVTGSIVQSARRQYLIYSEVDFEVFRPTWVTRCTDGGEIWRGGGDLCGGGDQRSPPPRQISPPSLQQLGYRTPKLKFLLRFDQNVEHKRPAGRTELWGF